jgi:acyl-CoA synthetase (NDP forming)/GNAT superfamily N-acetyltransferase
VTTAAVRPPGPGYPAHWEADVVLSDGATGRIRPITPDDAERLVAFYARVSDESKYYRFFAPHPTLSDADVATYTTVDYHDRVALIVLVGERMIAVGRFDRIDPGADEAEVAFLVEDAHQGRGLGSVLLEHLAQAARERSITRFVADVLPTNRKMIQVFTDAGYRVGRTYDDGVLHVEFDIDPTAESLEVSRGREHRAEARSVERLLTPQSVAVVGASRRRDKVGQALVRNLVLGGYTGPVFAVNRDAPAIAGVPAYPTLAAVPSPIDLAIVAVPAEAVPEVVADAAEKGVKGLVVVSSGFAEASTAGREAQQRLVALARGNGMRVLGPNCLGLVNTDPAFAVNASVSTVMPGPGRVGFFSQSGALGQDFLTQCVQRGLGISTFVSAGNRADVSGNDLLQYWEEDEGTDVVLLYLESIGNPRKFTRITRRLARAKPVVAVRTGRSTQGVPVGHTVGQTALAAEAVDAVFRQAGVVLVDTVGELFDVAQLLVYQPLPDGNRVAVLGNSDALGLLAADAALSNGLEVVGAPLDLGNEAGAASFGPALAGILDDPAVDAVVVVFAPRLESRAPEVASVLAGVAARSPKPIVTTFLGTRGVPEALRVADERGVLQRGSVPSYPSPEEAVRALARAVEYARWRAQPDGLVPELADVHPGAARAVVDRVLADAPQGRELHPDEVVELLASVGVTVYPMVPVDEVEDAVTVAATMGWDVVLKATAAHLRARPDLADVWRNIDTPDEMRDAWATMTRTLGAAAEARFVVQKMAPGGVPVAMRVVEDALYGPVVSFGVAGVATELLGDRSHRMPPLTDRDAAAMVREVRAAPMLQGYAGVERADLGAVEDLLHRLSALADLLPEVAEVELNPVLAGAGGTSVVFARGQVAPARSRADWFTRRLG